MDFDEVFCDLDPDTHCLRHGKPLVYDRYWRMLTSGCEDCEPEPDTFDEALATKLERQG